MENKEDMNNSVKNFIGKFFGYLVNAIIAFVVTGLMNQIKMIRSFGQRGFY